MCYLIHFDFSSHQNCLQQMLNCRSQTESIQITRKHIQESWIGLLIKNSLQIRNLLQNHKYILQSLWRYPHTCATHLQLFVRYEFVFRVYDVTIEKLSRYKISFIFLFFLSLLLSLFSSIFVDDTKIALHLKDNGGKILSLLQCRWFQSASVNYTATRCITLISLFW